MLQLLLSSSFSPLVAMSSRTYAPPPAAGAPAGDRSNIILSLLAASLVLWFMGGLIFKMASSFAIAAGITLIFCPLPGTSLLGAPLLGVGIFMWLLLWVFSAAEAIL